LSFRVFCLSIFFSPGSENPLRKKDREDISTLKERSNISLKKLGSLENNFSEKINQQSLPKIFRPLPA